MFIGNLVVEKTDKAVEFINRAIAFYPEVAFRHACAA